MMLICDCPSFGENIDILKDILTIILSESNREIKGGELLQKHIKFIEKNVDNIPTM